MNQLEKMASSAKNYSGSVLLIISLILIVIYLLLAYYFFAPRGYYGTAELPRFADPWIERSETLLNGGLLYRDVFTTTPPLTNLLIVIPSLVPIYFGNINPWATLSYMVFFSLFNIFTAYVIFKMDRIQTNGFRAAVLFLLNPLTFGNTILRRQDEAIVVFFISLAVLFMIRERHTLASMATGLALLIKLSGAIVIPVALFHYRKWQYLIIPPLVLFLVMAPFLALAGSDAVFFNPATERAQHPFQFRGVSLPALWNQIQDQTMQVSLLPVSVILILVVGITLLVIAYKRFGLLQDLILLSTAIFVVSPKLHTGYFSLVVMLMAPLIRRKLTAVIYLLFGLTALIADFYKWPIMNFNIAFWLMVLTLLLLVALAGSLAVQAKTERNKQSIV